MSDTPPFDEAMGAFLDFIRSQGFSTDLAWVFREDVTTCIRDEWIRVPIPPDNGPLSRDYFEYGRAQGRGVTISVKCRIGDRSACYFWVPEDDMAASYAMQTALKLSVPSNAVAATPVHSSLKWWWLTRTNQWRGCLRHLDSPPARADVRRLLAPGY